MFEYISSFFTDIRLWAFLASGLIIAVGFAGTILPVLPGTVMIYGGFLLYGLMTGFESLGWAFFLGQLILLGISYLVDFLASAYGVKIYGGSQAAIWGAVFGSLLILVIGPIGLLVGPLIGAVVGELYAGEELRRAFHCGFGSFIGLLGGTIIKLLIAAVMVGWFVLAIV